MQKLNEDLKSKEFKQIYLLYGQEKYLISLYKKKLINAMSSPGDTMNVSYFEGKDISVAKIIDLAQTLPFLAAFRLIVIEDSGFFKSAHDDLNDYLGNLPESCRIIFIENEVDKRSRLYKTVTKLGYAAEMKEQDTSMLQSWILSTLKKEGFRITNGAMNLLLLYTGAEMNVIDTELEKLICYKIGEKEIRAEDVEAITARRIEDHIFDMIEAVAAQKQSHALGLYYDLLSLKVPAGRILFLLTRQFNYMYQAKTLVEKGYDKSSIAQKTGLKPFIAGKYISQAGQFTTVRLKKMLEEGCSIEEDIKTGKITDKLAVEIILVKWSMRKR